MSPTKPTVLITGAVSLLGKYIIQELSQTYSLIAMVHRSPLDTALKNQVSEQITADLTRIQDFKPIISIYNPKHLIHLTALSDIDYCEKYPNQALAVNVGVTQRLVESLKGTNIHFVYPSSSMVFSGKNAPYQETAVPHPINVYGGSKREAEKIILSNIPQQATIIRSSTLFGWQPADARLNDLTYYLRELTHRRPLKLVTDRFFNPLSAVTAARAIHEIIKNRHIGIFHLGGKERISRFNFVKALIKTYDLKPQGLVLPVSYAFFALSLAPRPKDVTLTTDKIHRILRLTPRPLSSQLRQLKL